MSFNEGFQKEAFVGALAGALARGVGAVAKPLAGAVLKSGKWLGGKVIQGMGGKLNAAMTAAGAGADAIDYADKLKAAREGLS